MKIFVINLDKAKDRRLFQKKQLSFYGLDYEFLSAVSADDISQETYKKHSRDWQRPLKKTEVACYYSHRDAWERVLRFDQPILIMEDDALISKHLISLLHILKKEKKADLINLENRGRKKFVSRVSKPLGNHSKLLKLYQDRTGAACYVLWPSGAKKLLECEKNKGIALADAHITSCYQIDAFQVEPAAAIQLDYCDYYQMKNPVHQKLALSSVSSRNNLKGDWSFWLKRLYSQLKLGLRQLFFLGRVERRFIDIRTRDFFGQLD